MAIGLNKSGLVIMEGFCVLKTMASEPTWWWLWL